MERIIEFIGNNVLLSGLFAVVLAAWIIYEINRLLRKWQEVGTFEAVRLINREDPIILDVSNSTDFAKGHIQGALHMPPSRIESGNQELFKHKERPVLVYCRNGQVSPQMATRLTRMGFTSVYLLAGGLTQWSSDQQPVSRQKSTARPSSGGKGKEKKKAKSERKKSRQHD